MTTKVKSQEIGTIGKLIIPKEIENMIDFLHKSIGATEWSGILFYKMVGGDINKLNALEFKCEFLYPMNIGTSAYTEFDYNSEVMNAYDLKEELIECSSGLIHSHHKLGFTTFSGTDVSEHIDNAQNFNYYISLIVDFTKDWHCRIAFPSKTKNTYEHQIKNSEGELVTAIRSIEEDNIIIGELNVEFESVGITPEWLDKRVKELKVKKATPKVFTPVTQITGRTYPAMTKVMEPLKSYNDYDEYNENDFVTSWVNKQSIKSSNALPTPKEFLTALISLDETGASFGLEGAIMGIELSFDQGEVDFDTYDTALSNNVEIIHDEIYGSDRMFATHCNMALSLLENNIQMFSNETIYQIIKENLELYAK